MEGIAPSIGVGYLHWPAGPEHSLGELFPDLSTWPLGCDDSRQPGLRLQSLVLPPCTVVDCQPLCMANAGVANSTAANERATSFFILLTPLKGAQNKIKRLPLVIS